MGTAHLQPHGVRNNSWYNNEEIVTYKRQHINTLNRSEDRLEEEHRELRVMNELIRQYGFKEVRDGGEWINNGTGVGEKVIAETRHGVELRVKYHPQGSKYFFLIVTSGEFNQENLAIQHLEKYNQTLREVLQNTYGEVRRKTGRWTSEKLEV